MAERTERWDARHMAVKYWQSRVEEATTALEYAQLQLSRAEGIKK